MDNNKLKLEFNRFKNIPFPEDKSNNEEIGDIYFELVQYDDFIAGLIDKILKKDIVDVKELDYDLTIQERINEMLNLSNSEEDIKILNSYLDYLKELKNLLDCASALFRESL